MHSQDEVSRRNAVLMSTGRIFNIAMSKLPNHKHGQPLSSTVAEFVDIMEKEARKQSALFDALGRRMDEWFGSKEYVHLRMSQEYLDLRDMFMAMPEDLADEYSDCSFQERMKEHYEKAGLPCQE